MDKKVYLVLSDQYVREIGALSASFSESTVEAAFSNKAKAQAFIEKQPHKNQFGSLYWRVKKLPVDIACED